MGSRVAVSLLRREPATTRCDALPWSEIDALQDRETDVGGIFVHWGRQKLSGSSGVFYREACAYAAPGSTLHYWWARLSEHSVLARGLR